jgi:hypothetical protein
MFMSELATHLPRETAGQSATPSAEVTVLPGMTPAQETRHRPLPALMTERCCGWARWISIGSGADLPGGRALAHAARKGGCRHPGGRITARLPALDMGR